MTFFLALKYTARTIIIINIFVMLFLVVVLRAMKLTNKLTRRFWR